MQLAKPGYRTTEFWVTTLTSLAAFIAALSSHLAPRYAAVAAAIASGLYALSRGLAKRPAVVTTAPVTVQRVEPVPPPTTVQPR